MRRWLSLLVWLMAAAPALAAGPVTVDQRVKYYDVRGQSEAEIARSLRRDAPRELDGFQGQTTFEYTWTYNYTRLQGSGDQCKVSNARVKIAIVISLPRHREIDRVASDLRAEWSTYTAAMERHERHHAADFIEIGRRLPVALNGIRGACATIEDTANKKGMEFVDQAQSTADDFDNRTNHGEVDGTVWPGL